MTTLIRWDPFREMASLQNDMSRLMNGVLGAANGNGDTRTWIPPVDVWETDDEVVYALDLPGVSEDDVSVELEEGTLTISGTRERKDEVSKEGLYRYERRFGSFSRTIGLPQGVTDDSVKAEYKDGVLEVRVTKPEQPKPRRIQIGGGGQATIEGKSSKK
jgi:HSP20 family protein